MRVFCDRCRRETNHSVLKKVQKRLTAANTPDMTVDFAQGTWQVIRCQGCERVSFREAWATSEDYDPDTGEPQELVTIYPARSEFAVDAQSLVALPQRIRRLYLEVIASYAHGLRTLCAAGLRALIEAICADQRITGGPVKKDGTVKRRKNLEGKIEGLHENKLLSRRHTTVLHQHRYLGNDAVHKLDEPPLEELALGIKIIRHTLGALYEIDSLGTELRDRKNQRKQRRNPAPA